MRRALALLLLLPLAGCHSAYIETDLVNASGAKVPVVELDYPDASFGISAFEPGATMHYRFKVQGSGTTKLLWTDAAGHDHTAKGPELHEGQQGTLRVTLTADAPQWEAHLQP
jgi:hypothetical protein